MTDLAAALLADVPRYTYLSDYGHLEKFMEEADVLAALSAHLDAATAERAGEMVRRLDGYETYDRPKPGFLSDAADLITALLAQNAALRAERDKAVRAERQTYRDALEAQKAAEAKVEKLRGALDRIGKAWPIVRDADCSGGTLVSAIDEIDAALTTEADNG